VTFSAVSQALSVPQTLTACDGCSNSAPGGTLAAATASYNNSLWYGTYNAYGQITNGAYELESITLGCWVDMGNSYLGCPDIGQQTLSDTTYGQQCVIADVAGELAFTSHTYTCTFTQWGYFSSPNFSGWTWNGCPDPFNPTLADCGFDVASESVSSYGWTYTTYYMPGGCMSAGGGGSNVQNNATATANNWFNSNPAGYADTISRGTSFPSGYYCSDQSSCAGVSPGAPMPSDHQYYSQCQQVAGWHFAFNASQAATVQTQRLQNAVGSGYVLAPGYSVCGSGTVVPGSENGGHSSVTISCNASGAEMYNWTAALQSQLQQQLAGKQISAALSILQNTPGIDTSLTITICTTVNGTQECSPANDTAYLPTNPTQIALSIKRPNGATVQAKSGGGNLASAQRAGTLFAGLYDPAPDQWLPLEWQIPASVLAGVLVMLAIVWVVRFSRRLQSRLGSKESVDV
jgi:hypothetical protein